LENKAKTTPPKHRGKQEPGAEPWTVRAGRRKSKRGKANNKREAMKLRNNKLQTIGAPNETNPGE